MNTNFNMTPLSKVINNTRHILNVFTHENGRTLRLPTCGGACDFMGWDVMGWYGMSWYRTGCHGMGQEGLGRGEIDGVCLKEGTEFHDRKSISPPFVDLPAKASHLLLCSSVHKKRNHCLLIIITVRSDRQTSDLYMLTNTPDTTKT